MTRAAAQIAHTAHTALAALALLIAACSSTPTAPSAASPSVQARPEATIAPNVNLFAQGIPPIPASLVAQVAKYTDFRGHAFVDWHPVRREMLVSHLPAGASTAQLFRVTAPLAPPEQLTNAAEPVRVASYEPREGRYIVFARASGGDEADKLYRLDLPGREVTLLTDTPERHAMEGWLHTRSELLTLSSPLDRTAQEGTRASVTQTLRLLDPLAPAQARRLAELPGGGWEVGGVSWDDRQIALTRSVSVNESQVWLLDLASGALNQVLPPAGNRDKAAWLAGQFARDNSGLYVLTDSAGEFRELMFHRFADRSVTSISGDVPWNAVGATANRAGTLIAARMNVDGRHDLRWYDAAGLTPVAAPKLPPGSVSSVQFHPSLPDLEFSLTNARGPNQVWSVNPTSGTVEQWTRAQSPVDLDTTAFVEPTLVRWKSFDGRTISGILNRPPARFTGKRPVLIGIHGGPEAQATLGFLGRSNYYVNELGIALISPNVRGSAGYGKTFLSLDDGFKREDSVKDIGALLDWIATQPDLDASRVVVSGGSYGGYMSLAVATNYSERIAGAIDSSGISNFVTFLTNTESYRRDRRRVEYGDERDPAMRAHLEKISPLTSAGKIRKPLFVVQGKNDPRVPVTEAEQIVAKVRANGSPVWYLRGENEGHGFARKENADFQFYATVLFLRQTLGLD